MKKWEEVSQRKPYNTSQPTVSLGCCLLQLSSLTTCSLLMLTFYLLNIFLQKTQTSEINPWHCLYEPQKRGQCNVWPPFDLANPTRFFPKGLHRKPQETKGGERGVLSTSLKDFS